MAKGKKAESAQSLETAGSRPAPESEVKVTAAADAAAAAKAASVEADQAQANAGEEMEKKMRKIRKKLASIAEIKKKPAASLNPEEVTKMSTEEALEQELRLLQNPKLRAQVKAQAEAQARKDADAAAVLAAAKAKSCGAKEPAPEAAKAKVPTPNPVVKPAPKAKAQTKPAPDGEVAKMSEDERTKALRKAEKKLRQIEEILAKDPQTLDSDQKLKVSQESAQRELVKQLRNPWREA